MWWILCKILFKSHVCQSNASKQEAFKVVIHLTGWAMGVLRGLFVFFGVKHEEFVFQTVWQKHKRRTSYSTPLRCDRCLVTLRLQFPHQLGSQVAKWWLSWKRCTVKLCSFIIPLHFLKSLGKVSKSYEIYDSIRKYLVLFDVWEDSKENSKNAEEMLDW